MSFPDQNQCGGDPAGQGNQAGQDGNYWQSEAKRAFAARDAAKSEADTLRKQLAELNQKLSAVSQRAQQTAHGTLRLAVEAAIGRAGNIVPTAHGDVAEAVSRRLGIGDDLQPVVLDEYGNPRSSPNDPSRAMSIEEAVAEYVSARPHLRRAFAPASTGLPPGATGGVPRVFDAARLGDPQYAKQWKDADPEGFKVAWKEHLKRVAAQPIPGSLKPR